MSEQNVEPTVPPSALPCCFSPVSPSSDDASITETPASQPEQVNKFHDQTPNSHQTSDISIYSNVDEAPAHSSPLPSGSNDSPEFNSRNDLKSHKRVVVSPRKINYPTDEENLDNGLKSSLESDGNILVTEFRINEEFRSAIKEHTNPVCSVSNFAIEQYPVGCETSKSFSNSHGSRNAQQNTEASDKELSDSASTDGTLLNSDASSEVDEFVAIKLYEAKSSTMGNRQAGNSGKQSDDDTPDDGRTKCCEIPKKKVKDRTGRVNRHSRSDDLAFDTNEVYPFEGRTRSEQELNEPVELEPFEIVETDDIKFVPGAGTSDVIKSAVEPKFTPIPEESVVPEEDCMPSTSYSRDETEVKVPYYVDKGSRLPEAGTATAHSTFEFKQVKPKYRKLPAEQKQHTYENVQMSPKSDTEIDSRVKVPETSSNSSESSSSNGSKDSSRKNSKDIIQKPSRKGKSKTNNDNASTSVLSTEGENQKTTKEESKSKTKQSVRDSEIDRNIDSVLMLTQTMFSQTKTSKESKVEVPNKDINETAPVIQYENVNVCAKLEPTGISIGHKNVPVTSSKNIPKTSQVDRDISRVLSQVSKDIKAESKIKSKETKVKPSTSAEGNDCRPAKCMTDVIRDVKPISKQERKEARKELSYDIIEISDTGTLIIKSLADLPSARRCDDGNCEEDVNDDTDDTDDFSQSENTDHKTPYGTGGSKSQDSTNSKQDIERSPIAKVNDAHTEMKETSIDKEEHVPPPSPLAMITLEEEEEVEGFDENGAIDIDVREEDRRKSEIIEFSENVCKRLSQLLENMSDDNIDYDNDEDVFEFEENEKAVNEEKEPELHYYETCAYSNHIYETIDGSGRIVVAKQHSRTNDKESFSEPALSAQTEGLKPPERSESSSTLKRTSGDSETYQEKSLRDRSHSSEDDLPDFFDPREIPPPKTDSEILNDVIGGYEMGDDDISADAEANLIQNQDFSSDDIKFDKENKNVNLSLKTFASDLLDDTPTTGHTVDLQDMTPTADAHPNLTPLMELAKAEEETTAVQFDTSGSRSVTCTESDLDTSEHRDDLSTDSMLADDEAEETMEILFTKTYTEPVEGAEVFLSCTVVNSAYKDGKKKSETWLSDEAMEYFEANASEVMSTAFIKAKREMKDIQICLQSLRKQMEHFHSDCEDVRVPDLPGLEDSLSPEYFGVPRRKAVTD